MPSEPSESFRSREASVRETSADGDLRAERAKFDLGGPGPTLDVSDVGELPWAYGENRVTAVVRDPDSAYLYWEITDEGISAARSRLGAAGLDGWCNLRVYDTTGRDFDGTNANDYFDIRVERTDRDYFLMIRRPTSAMHVEVGIKTHEGFFQPIARSGRAEFPRSDPSPNTHLEWLTVTSYDAPPAASPCRSRYGGPEPHLPGRAGAGYVDVWRAAYAPTTPPEPAPLSREHASRSGAGMNRRIERTTEIERWWWLDEWRSETRGGLRFSHSIGLPGEGLEAVAWREGPYPFELLDRERIAVELLGEAPERLQAEGVDFTVFGPWRYTMRSADVEPHRRVLATWSVRWVRATTPMIERWGLAAERAQVAAYERQRVELGASEKHALLERGASELWRIGGSERIWLGASEWAMRGASETLFLAASQLALAGASALLYRGASERLGASERWRASVGGSEWVGGGAKGGASEAAAGGKPPQGAEPELYVGERWAERPGSERR